LVLDLLHDPDRPEPLLSLPNQSDPHCSSLQISQSSTLITLTYPLFWNPTRTPPQTRFPIGLVPSHRDPPVQWADREVLCEERVLARVGHCDRELLHPCGRFVSYCVVFDQGRAVLAEEG
jgi:hypothetical protein